MSGLPNHISRNRAAWDRAAAEYAEPGRRARASDQSWWGIWHVPESELRLLPAVSGLDVIELGCGTAHVSSWLCRRGARVTGGAAGTRARIRAAGWRAVASCFPELSMPIEFHLGHGDWIRLLRGNDFVTSGARRWPCEEVWKARKRTSSPATQPSEPTRSSGRQLRQ